MYCCLFFFLCFKQKPAYEMRISDWSSDVCSSDLGAEFDLVGRVLFVGDHVFAEEAEIQPILTLRQHLYDVLPLGRAELQIAVGLLLPFALELGEPVDRNSIV